VGCAVYGRKTTCSLWCNMVFGKKRGLGKIFAKRSRPPCALSGRSRTRGRGCSVWFYLRSSVSDKKVWISEAGAGHAETRRRGERKTEVGVPWCVVSGHGESGASHFQAWRKSVRVDAGLMGAGVRNVTSPLMKTLPLRKGARSRFAHRTEFCDHLTE